MKEKYQPISCNYHDILLAEATKQTFAKISYYTETGELTTAQSVIKDVYTKGGEEFMKLESGEIIRLDKIVSVEEHLSPHYAKQPNSQC